MTAPEEVAEIADELRRIADRLAAPGIGDEEAEALARRAADLAARGGAAIEAELRELAAREPGEANS